MQESIELGGPSAMAAHLAHPATKKRSGSQARRNTSIRNLGRTADADGKGPPLFAVGASARMLRSAMYALIDEDMRIDHFAFGSIRIDGVMYEHDVVISHGEVRKRKKKASRPFRDAFGHTPLSVKEDIPWDCRQLVVGTGADGALPVMDEVKAEAARREVALVTVPTREAIRASRRSPRARTRSCI
ncbi:MAG: MTH938/NDUFAF3 family protein [Actinomycetota bacterium]